MKRKWYYYYMYMYGTLDRKLTWEDIWKYETYRLSFILWSVHDLLPSPINLCRCGLITNPYCSLSRKSAALEHVLSSCSTALRQGRYRWRYDNVLMETADWLESEQKKSDPQPGHINFVRPGSYHRSRRS